jgi:hypothetical protein
LRAGVQREGGLLMLEGLGTDRVRQQAVVDGLKEAHDELGIGVVRCDQSKRNANRWARLRWYGRFTTYSPKTFG